MSSITDERINRALARMQSDIQKSENIPALKKIEQNLLVKLQSAKRERIIASYHLKAVISSHSTPEMIMDAKRRKTAARNAVKLLSDRHFDAADDVERYTRMAYERSLY